MRYLNNEKIREILRCPICNCGMKLKTQGGTSLICDGPRTHCYDFSSSGYVNFSSPSQSGGGDSKAAVRARSEFLNLGYYKNVADALAAMCVRHGRHGGVLVDAGCGEGYYASFLAQKGFNVFGVDLSKFAVEAASKRLAHNGFDNFFFATASVFDLPIADESVDVITNVFAPCAENSYSEILKKEGILVMAYAGERHLYGLKQAVYKTANVNTERADMPMGMTKLDECRVHYTTTIEGTDNILSLFAMTPYYWRTSPTDAQKLIGMTSLTTEVDVIIDVYRKS